MDSASKTPTEVTQTKTRAVSCDGGDGPFGHPKVYLRIADKQVTCPYCSRLFVLAPGATDHAH